MKYSARPPQVDAVQFDGSDASISAIDDLAVGPTSLVNGFLCFGNLSAAQGDWVVKNSIGGLSVLVDADFHSAYEAVS